MVNGFGIGIFNPHWRFRTGKTDGGLRKGAAELGSQFVQLTADIVRIQIQVRRNGNDNRVCQCIFPCLILFRTTAGTAIIIGILYHSLDIQLCPGILGSQHDLRVQNRYHHGQLRVCICRCLIQGDCRLIGCHAADIYTGSHHTFQDTAVISRGGKHGGDQNDGGNEKNRSHRRKRNQSDFLFFCHEPTLLRPITPRVDGTGSIFQTYPLGHILAGRGYVTMRCPGIRFASLGDINTMVVNSKPLLSVSGKTARKVCCYRGIVPHFP